MVQVKVWGINLEWTKWIRFLYWRSSETLKHITYVTEISQVGRRGRNMRHFSYVCIILRKLINISSILRKTIWETPILLFFKLPSSFTLNDHLLLMKLSTYTWELSVALGTLFQSLGNPCKKIQESYANAKQKNKWS